MFEYNICKLIFYTIHLMLYVEVNTGQIIFILYLLLGEEGCNNLIYNQSIMFY